MHVLLEKDENSEFMFHEILQSFIYMLQINTRLRPG